ncbi:restriction endonuclease subunit S [Mesomycoplasma ovipneumoniae]|uniref:restriction endonuclease subunit S n=1 Tax=Mesomycoplasma ovipneumoniae TaxID=29562 RepID=UPI0028B0C4AC|nr:restriction endonuclease subunit S [Mesomycoplasma ovipneumoniae]MDW2933688.1 restriction endonuclease subunit S [Mesomycoplasma ovipneumoniae]WNM15778.1 restriction endonuclease subunit S [Mesomycoplasma ovipneumoniae]
MNRYESYKEVNLPWLKEVPSHWEIIPISHVFEERRERNNNGNNQFILSVMKNIGVIPYTDKGNVGNKASENIENYKVVYPNDLVLNSMNMMIGSLGKSNYKGVLSQVYYVLKLMNSSKYNIDYLNYLFKNKVFHESFRVLGKGILDHRLRVPIQLLKYEKIIIPPINEQEQIANYLDWKINEIDRLIQIEKGRIDLLKKVKKITITDNITGRTLKNSKLLDSKYDWIGYIPKDFKIVRLKKLTSQIVDGTHNTPTYIENGIPFLRVTDISNLNYKEKIDLKRVAQISEKEHNELIKRCKPEKGDVLISKNGTIGIPIVVDWDWEFSIFVSLCLLKVNDNVIPYWIYFYFLSELVNMEIAYGGKKGTIVNLHLEKISNFKVPLPNLKTQKIIIEKIIKKIEIIDKAIKNIQSQIENLKLLKQSLISEVVTGKIDVRNVVIPEYEKATLLDDETEEFDEMEGIEDGN